MTARLEYRVEKCNIISGKNQAKMSTLINNCFVAPEAISCLIGCGITEQQIARCVQAVESMPTRVAADSCDTAAMATVRIFLACTSRSGSTYLGQLLGSQSDFPTIRESLNTPRLREAELSVAPASLQSVIAHIIMEEAENEIYGVKSEFAGLIRLFQIGEFPQHLHRWKWLHLCRENRVAQAISIVKATKTRLWQSYGAGNGTTLTHSDYDHLAIGKAINSIEKKERIWRDFFAQNNLPFLRIVYEDLERDALSVVRQIRDFLGLSPDVDIDLSRVRTERMRDELSSAWEARFRTEKT